MTWLNGWIWIAAALVLAVFELFLPGWVFMGIAAAVALMGLMLLTGLWGASLPMTLVVTAALSGVTWLLFRRIWRSSRGETRIWDRDINE